VVGGNRNASELLFEEYLTVQGYTQWSHEPPFEGKRRRPDYFLEYGGSAFAFEVKEFETSSPGAGFGYYDPYEPIRKKVSKAVQQFKEYKEYPCSLVLANPKCVPLINLSDPWTLFGAMFGNVGFRFPVGSAASVNKPIERTFTTGGRMVDKHHQPENTTVNSIIFLGLYPLRAKYVDLAVRRRRQVLDRDVTTNEILECYEEIPDDPQLRRPRVKVYENPYARIPLSRDLFNGAYDERWLVDGEVIKRVYAGSEVARFEDALGES
jgi:hypothetical protein